MTKNNESETTDIRKVLVLFAHPAMHLSKTNKQLIRAYEGLDGLTFHDLYETYPSFFIDVDYEQKLLQEHDIIIFHYPLHWYNFPPLLKHWQDMVLTTDFVLSKHKRALAGKFLLNVVTTGGTKESYQEEGRNHYDLTDYLVHVEQTSRICKMIYLPPFVIHNSRDVESINKTHKSASFLRLTIESLQYLSDEEIKKVCQQKYINDDLSAFINDDENNNDKETGN